MEFTELPDLASSRVGGSVLEANDEFFAPRSNLLKPQVPVFIEGRYTPRGKWMDGWETRRRRVPGHDWCVVRLGMRGIVRGVDIDTAHFTGNFPESASLDGCDLPAGKGPGASTPWSEILPRSPLKGGTRNLLPVSEPRPWTHLRLNIFPDGGIARLRVHGEVVPDWDHAARSKGPVDLAAVRNGGLALASSDMFFGSRMNLLMPGRAKNMGDGWETRRRRGPGYDWVLIQLGTAGTIDSIEVDTNHFKGNYPDACMIEGCLASGPSGPSVPLVGPDAWTQVLPRTKLGPHRRQAFSKELRARGPFTHVRLSIYPDGGVSRLRIYGRPRTPQ